ncbi:3-keto-disaccharide hydrolase [Hirschia litorea]|uniref:DUF1080 domain-containing protein n=1 Tax=Hirschia litorea TaxID=1199156 RepID=A0ABW2INM6_9PROT
MNKFIGISAICLAAACTSQQGFNKSSPPSSNQTDTIQNPTIERQSPTNFTYLWDGETFDGWQFVDGSQATTDRWIIEGSTLKSIKSDTKREKDSQSIFTDKSYSNFELMFDFKVADGANSGVKYLSKLGEKSLPEYQIVFAQPDKPSSNTGLGAFFAIASPQYQHAQGRDARQSNSEWQNGKIVVKDKIIQHWLNGVKIIEINRCSPEFNAQVASSMFKEENNFGKRASGKIMLQYNDGGVDFRNIKIKDHGGASKAENICTQ